jgi:hypothetical protein
MNFILPQPGEIQLHNDWPKIEWKVELQADQGSEMRVTLPLRFVIFYKRA